ncbi:MAG: alpha/beta fold hydrolase [Gammaproteobacteria bacterium]
MRTLIWLTLAGFFLASPAALAQTCGGQAATLVGTEGDDDLRGTPGDDIIAGLGGNDRILGLGGNDLICGGDGDDDLIGGDGDDELIGGADNDVMEGNAGIDSCDGVTGIDSADEPCETQLNTDTRVFPVTLFADDGFELPGALYVPKEDALIGGEYRQVAMVVSHGAMGSFSSSVPKIIGLQASPLGFTVLAMDRRDAGPSAGGGAVLFEDATLDLGVGVDLLAALGYEAIYVAGHSQGTQNASIYPSFSADPRVAAVGMYGQVDDGRSTARDLLFNGLFGAPIPYEGLVVIAQDNIDAGQGDDIVAWDTVFGQAVFRSSFNFLSFWGPDSLSVPVREIGKLEIPAFLLRADGDEFTPDAMSQNVLAAALDAGVDATYTVLPYVDRQGDPIPLTDNGGNAHGFVGVERQTIATTVDWLESRVPESVETKPGIRLPTDDGSGNNFRPFAYGGTQLTVPINQATITLDGTRSSDIDGEIVSYVWSQISGPAVTLDDVTSPKPTFDTPEIPDEPPAQTLRTANVTVGGNDEAPRTSNAQVLEELVFLLTVMDEDGGSDNGEFQVVLVEASSAGGGGGGSSSLGLGSLLALLIPGGMRRRRQL